MGSSVKLIIAGCRHFEEEIVYAELVKIRITNHPMAGATEIVSGKAKGVDTAGEDYAEFYLDGKVKEFPPDKAKYGTKAFHIRNNKMAVYGDALLLIWNGKSAGSQHMKNAMIALGKPVYEFIYKDEDMKWESSQF